MIKVDYSYIIILFNEVFISTIHVMYKHSRRNDKFFGNIVDNIIVIMYMIDFIVLLIWKTSKISPKESSIINKNS